MEAMSEGPAVAPRHLVHTAIDERTLDLLDFPAVRERLASCCASELGHRLAEAVTPSTSPRQVAIDQAETAEARALLDGGAAPGLHGIHDVAAICVRASRGGRCEAAEILLTADTAAACRRLRAHFARQPGPAGAARLSARTPARAAAGSAGAAEVAAARPPAGAASLDRANPRAAASGTPEPPAAERLADYALRLGEFRVFEEAVARALDPEGAIRDDATPALAALRRRQRVLHARVRERLEAMVRSPALAPYLQDPIVTMRHDRFVVPVRADARAQVPGVVHDASSSGATVFVEPLPVLELNNDLRRAQAEEEAEVERILAALSEALGRISDPLLASLDILAHLDLVFARAELARQMDARSFELAAEPLCDLVRARHPLLAAPVPVDVRVGTDFDVLVVTGPNTGGKTVALKTVGLFACMAQSGLQLPAGDGTRMGVFRQVFCDVGDDQGVAQNLSTFSSHMGRVVAILGTLQPGALVLLDEMGAGTDPAEGAALATAILESLLGRGARCIATTHASELKAFAYREPRVQNASVDFDAETLAPTYRLIIGLPGGSHALQIAARLGLPEDVIERARALLSPGERHVETLIAGMAEDGRRLRDARAAAESARAEADRLRRELDERSRKAEDRRADLLAEARAQAAEILRQARREADDALRALRRAQSGSAAGVADVESARTAIRQQLDELTAEPPPQAPLPPPPGGWRPGMAVRVRSLRQTGRLLARPGPDGTVPVQVGILRVNAAVGDLDAVAEPQTAAPVPPARTGSSSAALAAAADLPAELDLRGLRADEALERLDRYLDDMALAGRAEARIIHGKGTGALRQAVGEYLHGHRLIASYRLGETGEGGDGVTVITLRG